MRGLMGIVGWMAIVMSTAAYGRAAGFADIPKLDRVKVAQAAELKGDLARVHEEFNDAVVHYKTALRATPENAKLHNKLGITYLQLHNNGSARKAFNQALKRDPYFANALNNLGAVACLEKKYTVAMKYLKQSLALDETNASAHLNMAEAWAGVGDMDRAMTEYARALELNADILSGSPDGVLIRVSTPEQRGRVDYMIAMAYARRGNYDGALEYLRRARDEHFTELAKVYQTRVFEPLWNDPRLEKIVKR